MHFVLALALAAALTAATPAPAGSGAEGRFASEARAEAAALMKTLGTELREQLTGAGPEAAIAICRERAPGMAGAASRRTGWKITRVSLEVRNPLLGSPDAWEQRVLAEFDARAAAGERAETLERAEVVEEPQGKVFRYMKAIPVQGMCLQCHGPREAIPPGVKAVLATEYPHDQAVGYKPDAVRGGVSVKRRL